MKSSLARSLTIAALFVAACNGEEVGTESDDLTEIEVAVGDSVELTVPLDQDGSVIVTVDCAPPEDPDRDGAILSVSAPDLEAPSALRETARAGYWQWAGKLSAGEHALALKNEGNVTARCNLSVKEQPNDGDQCNAWSVHRSVVSGAMHIPVGDEESGDWESLPASGNHWGAWAPWGVIYPRPVLRGFYLHNLEHGGAVLSYGCSSRDESAACARAEDDLVALANAFGQNRVIVTPDPDQPTLYAVRTWRWAYASDCFDKKSARAFLSATFRNGREDIDADPPVPFDPTTTEDVPCENLMSAPDSC